MLAGIALSLSGCGAAPAEPPAATPAAPAPADHGGHHGSSGALELWAVQSGPLGVVVTDGSGRLLYRSDRDGPSTSACVDACTATWEPVDPGATPPSLLGVDAGAVGSFARPDGGTQLTLAGWPLYRRVGEEGGLAGPGANGTDGVWFAVAPDGSKAAAG